MDWNRDYCPRHSRARNPFLCFLEGVEMSSADIIETFDLTKRYGRQKAVNGLNLTVREGEIFGFLGPNGAGKTTTLLMLLGLSRPTRGYATVCGMNPLRKAREVKKQAGYLPENVGFYGDMDATQSLEYIARLNGLKRVEIPRKIEETLELVGLEAAGKKKQSPFPAG